MPAKYFLGYLTLQIVTVDSARIEQDTVLVIERASSNLQTGTVSLLYKPFCVTPDESHTISSKLLGSFKKLRTTATATRTSQNNRGFKMWKTKALHVRYYF